MNPRRGSFRILVRADVANQERETNEANNLIASPALPLAVRPLTEETPASGALSTASRAESSPVMYDSGGELPCTPATSSHIRARCSATSR